LAIKLPLDRTKVISNKPTVLILCTGNSCRSHIAEDIMRQGAGDFIDVQSAGSKPAGYVHPKAVEVMREIGIDISSHRSKHLDEFLDQNKIETVITVCGNADQACPMFPGQVNRYHWGFDDPAKAQGTDEDQLAVFRRVRDEVQRIFEAYAAGRRDQHKATETAS
jgi:arsenate reductase (thioredoxin)